MTNIPALSESDLFEKIRMLKSRKETDRPAYKELVDELFFRMLGQDSKQLAGTKVEKVYDLGAFRTEALKEELEKRLAPKPDWRQVVSDCIQDGQAWTESKLIQACKAQNCEEKVTPKMLSYWVGYAQGFVLRDGKTYRLRSHSQPQPKLQKIPEPQKIPGPLGSRDPEQRVLFQVQKKRDTSGAWIRETLEMMTDGKPHDLGEIRRHVRLRGFDPNPDTVAKSLARMALFGELVRTGKAQYRLP